MSSIPEVDNGPRNGNSGLPSGISPQARYTGWSANAWPTWPLLLATPLGLLGPIELSSSFGVSIAWAAIT
ncbi:hypothetical protein D3C77_474980 [compost metagenome]